MRRAAFPAAAALLGLASCAAPKQRHAPAPSPTPPVLVPAPPPSDQTDWRDLPLTPGSWTYAREIAGSAATYGLGGPAIFTVRCDAAARLIMLIRPAAAGGAMTVQTSYASRTIPAASGLGGVLVASLAARDAALDQIAFSRGRFSVAVAGLPTLYLPAWAEPARVVEDCR